MQSEEQNDVLKEYMEEVRCLKETIKEQEEIIKSLKQQVSDEWGRESRRPL